MDSKTHYEEYTITNGTVQWNGENGKVETATALGCTGSLSTETEIKEVVKNCEGQAVKTWAKAQKMTATFVGHMPVDVVRRAFGLSNKGLKAGVYAYGVDSLGGSGIFTWETWDIEETERKFLAFPNGSFSGGLKINIENGGDEIAQVEMSLTFMKDNNKKFYYEAFESDLSDETLKNEWMTKFNIESVLETGTAKSTDKTK